MEPIVSIIMGSTSDLPVMEKTAEILNDFRIPFEMNALSAHRTPEEVEKFAKLMGDSNTGEANVPVGMIYIFGLRICWDRKVFIDQAVRAGDRITFYKPAKTGDTITTKLSIADKKEVRKEKDGKVRINKFLYINMNATNQNNEKITDIQMSFLLPRTMQ